MYIMEKDLYHKNILNLVRQKILDTFKSLFHFYNNFVHTVSL